MVERLLTLSDAEVLAGDYREALDEGLLLPADLVCVDAPYSARTHSGHGTVERWGEESGGVPPSYDGAERRALSYAAWSKEDVDECVGLLAPLCRGWFVTLTDHVLVPLWEAALRRAGRYVFAPLPYLQSGARVRLTGDGPSSWTTWIVVARPKAEPYSSWGTLPGGYVLPPGQKVALPVAGGKQPWLMQRIVEDYSRPGDLVLDPCCGGGTTLVAALRCGRRALGVDRLRAHAEIAATWCRVPGRLAPDLGEQVDPDDPQGSLF